MMHMQPMVLQSVGDCPLFMEGMQWLCTSPAFVKRAVFALTDKMVWSMIGRPVNSIRKDLGLRPMRSFYHDALHGAEAVGVLFPEWFAPPQPDWPAHVRQLGFPLTLSATQPIPTEIENFLSAGEPPVVWTHGSANFDIAHFQARAIACSQELGIRSLLVSLDPPQTALPPNILHVRHVRLRTCFPAAVPWCITEALVRCRRSLRQAFRISSCHARTTSPTMGTGSRSAGSGAVSATENSTPPPWRKRFPKYSHRPRSRKRAVAIKQ